MQKIEVKILNENLHGESVFLARLTQRGHKISSMCDLVSLYDECYTKKPSKELLTLPHSTIRRFNYITVAITGLSTKALTQFRTHAKRATFISTSTQYSSFESREDNFVMPPNISTYAIEQIQEAYDGIQDIYNALIAAGVDKDAAGYILPQSLRKALVMTANLDDWQYILSLRLCHRNTEETQHIAQLILKEIRDVCGPEYIAGMLPSCAYDGKCKEGKFCCGVQYGLMEKEVVE